MRQITMVVSALLLFLFVSCEKEQQEEPKFDWDMQPSDTDKPATDDAPTGEDSGQDDLTDGTSDDPDDEPQPDGDQPVTEQKPDNDGSTDAPPTGDQDGPLPDETNTDEILIDDTDEILTTNHRPVADAGPDLTALIGYEVKIDAGKSYDFDQDEIDFQWAVVSQPAGSNIQIDLTDEKKPIFRPSVKGVYTFRLIVNDGKVYSLPDNVSVNVADYEPMDFEIVDSAYSKTLDSIVFVSEEPKNMVHIFNIETKSVNSIPLPLIPIAISISPNGNEAVVGHDGWFSHIDLVTKKRIDTYNVPTVVSDIVFGTNDHIYIFPDISRDLLVYSIVTGEETSRYEEFGSGAHAVINPDDERMFVIQSSSVILMDISIDPPEPINTLKSDFPIGNDLWMAETDSKIFTQQGSIFASDDMAQLTYMGRLEELETVKHLHNLGAEGRTVAIPDGADDIQLNLYKGTYMEYEKTIKLPVITLNQLEYQYHGEVVYFNKDDTKIVTVISTKIGTIDNYALAIIENF